MKRHLFLLISFPWLGLANCSESHTNEVRPDKQELELLPVEFTLRQRSTEAVPGSDGQLLVTIDDVTRNQVMVSVATAGGELLLPQRSMSPVAAAEFGFEGQSLVLRLTELHNALVGDDFAKFHLSDAAVEAAERLKIDMLIRAIEGHEEATFLRNGGEHTAEEAAEHLRMKLDAAAPRPITARAFIDGLASKSLQTGEPYRIRLADGQVVEAGVFLHEQLQAIERAMESPE